MPPLSSRARADLPDSAFAYIDSKGRRRLPVNDVAHVRNALARFNQTRFEDEAARDRARLRLLKAAKKYGIVPIGFMRGQLGGARPPDPSLPEGLVTLMLADVQDSTGLVQKLGAHYGSFLTELRSLLRSAISSAGGIEIDARADEIFAVFQQAGEAVAAALQIQRGLSARTWPEDAECKLRIGLHRGQPARAETGYVGLAVHTAARVCSAAHGGQVLVSQSVWTALSERPLEGVRLRSLGTYRLQGLPAPEELYQLEVEDLPAEFPPPRAAAADPVGAGAGAT